MLDLIDQMELRTEVSIETTVGLCLEECLLDSAEEAQRGGRGSLGVG